MKTKKTQKCRNSRCDGIVVPPGQAYCTACRAVRAERYRRRRQKHSRNAHVEAAYRARGKAQRLRASARWVKKNLVRKAQIRILTQYTKAGKIIRPDCCNDCLKKKKPIVAYGLSVDEGVPSVAAWCCWACWWVRRRADQVGGP